MSFSMTNKHNTTSPTIRPDLTVDDVAKHFQTRPALVREWLRTGTLR